MQKYKFYIGLYYLSETSVKLYQVVHPKKYQVILFINKSDSYNLKFWALYFTYFNIQEPICLAESHIFLLKILFITN